MPSPQRRALRGSRSPTTATATSPGTTATQTATYQYDAENRLTSRSDAGGGSDRYEFDGNGTLVRRSLGNGAWTVYIGGVYELHSDGSVVKYYTAMGKTIAVRQAGTLSYPLQDQLGSTVGVMDTSGAVTGTQMFWPYGATRASTGVLAGTAPTDRQYTGQQQEAPASDALGLYNYNARFYSTTLGRFVSADPTDGSGLNRYAYVLDDPTGATDPSGLYLFLACGWGQDCNQGSHGQRGAGHVEQWRSVMIQYWLRTGRFGADMSHLNFVFDLFAGALSKGFSPIDLVNTFDAFAWDSSPGENRRDAAGAARDLSGIAWGVHAFTGQNITYLAGFSFGAVTINEYLYGVSKGKLFGVAPYGVYFVGGPNVHRANALINLAENPQCGFSGCDEPEAFPTLGGLRTLTCPGHSAEQLR